VGWGGGGGKRAREGWEEGSGYEAVGKMVTRVCVLSVGDKSGRVSLVSSRPRDIV